MVDWRASDFGIKIMEKAVKIAKTYEKQGKIPLAIYELQQALHSRAESKEEEQQVQEKLRELIILGSKEQHYSGSESLLKSLLLNLDSKDLAIASEAAKKLLIFLQEQEFFNKAAVIAEATLNFYEKLEASSEIRATLLHILAILTHTKLNIRELVCSRNSSILASDFINIDLPISIASAATDLLICLIIKESDDDVDSTGPLIQVLFTYLDIFGFEKLEMPAKKLPTVFKNRKLAGTFLNYKTDFLARMAMDQENRLILKQCLAMALSFYDNLNCSEISFLQKNISNEIIYKFDNRYIWLLMCIFECSPNLIAYFLSENLLEDLIGLLNIEKDTLPIISTLSLAFGSSQVRAKLSPESLNNLKSVKLNSIVDKNIKISYILSLIKCCSNEYLGDGKIILTVIDDFCVGDKSNIDQLKYLEAFTYLSTRGNAKEKICAKFAPLCEIFSSLKKSLKETGDFAILSILYNLTLYPQILNEEEQQVQKLQELSGLNPTKDQYNSSEFVSKRVQTIVENSNVIALLSSLKPVTIHSMKLMSSIYLSIATNQKLRGKLVQAGSCKKLILLANTIEKKDGLDAAQALAKMAITSNPALAFKGELTVELIRPLIGLLRNGNLLCQFESLMALTNLAGYSDLAREKIVSGGLEIILDLQFSSNKMIRRAATEALCNLVFHDAVFNLVTIENSQLLAIMVALSDDDDFATSRAASGFIATISAEKCIILGLLKQKRFIEIFESLLVSSYPEIQHRAIETVKNIVLAGYSSKIATLAKILENQCQTKMIIKG